MRLYDLTYHNELHSNVTLSYITNYLRQWGVSLPSPLVMIIDLLEIDRWIRSDNLYHIIRVK